MSSSDDFGGSWRITFATSSAVTGGRLSSNALLVHSVGGRARPGVVTSLLWVSPVMRVSFSLKNWQESVQKLFGLSWITIFRV